MPVTMNWIKKNKVATSPILSQRRWLALLFVLSLCFVSAEALAEDSGTKHGSLSELDAMLSDPMSDVWVLFTEFDLSFNRGDIAIITGFRLVVDF